MKCLLPFSHRRPTPVWMLCWLPHLRGSVVSYWQYISTQVGRPHYGTCAMLLQDTTGAVKTSKHSLTIPYHTDWPRGLPKQRNQNLSIVVFICWPFMRKLPLLRELSAFQLSDVKPKPRLSQVTFGREEIFIGNQWVLRVKTGKQPEARMVLRFTWFWLVERFNREFSRPIKERRFAFEWSRGWREFSRSNTRNEATNIQRLFQITLD